MATITTNDERLKRRTSPGMVITMSLGLMAHMTQVSAFVVKPLYQQHHYKSTTKIFLEDWVANMIDGEVDRQEHKSEYNAAWMKKNKGAILSRLSDVSTTSGMYPSQMLSADQMESFAEHKRDERMAFLKPEKYCADRCVATGNCDIYEDFYELGPEDVLKFCEECVLNFDEESADKCDVPDAFYEKEPPLRP